MFEQRREAEEPSPRGDVHATTDLTVQVERFAGPPEQFLAHLLSLQCNAAPADAGAVLRLSPDGLRAIALYPPSPDPSQPPAWLRRCLDAVGPVISSRETSVLPLHDPADLYGQPARRQLVVVPLGKESASGAAAFVIEPRNEADLATRRERLDFTRTLLNFYEMRLAAEGRGRDMGRLRAAMETLAAINEHERFAGVAMSFCNEVASRWQADRVGFGVLKGRYVQLKALSHTEKFSRKMTLVQDIESAMEECLDQDVEVTYPAPSDATSVSRAAAELSKRHGPTVVLGLPLRRKGEPVGVVTVERPAGEAFAPEEIEALRLACDLCTSRLMNLYEHDRWFGARAVASLREGLAVVAGPKHTWAKLIVVLGFAAVVFLVFAKGEYRAEAPFVLEATEQQVIPAPFDGYLKEVNVEPPDMVEAGKTELATLDTAELRLQLASSRAELAGYLKESAAAMRDGKTADAQIAEAKADKTRAEMRLLEHRIGQATILSPLSGCVVKGELKRKKGAPVKTGDVLFEIAPLESIRAVLSVPEDLIADVIAADRKARAEGKELHGELATAAHPEIRVPFVVERINPVAEVVNQRNVFKVRVKLLEVRHELRMQPGMEGAAKIDIEPRRYAWIWTRRLVNWVRMKLWL